MLEKRFTSNLPFAGGSQALLERVLCAEYLLAKGYLTSDLEELSPQAAKSLMDEASRFATRRLAEFEFIDSFQYRPPFSLN